MTEDVFVTFKVWDNGKLTKTQVRDVAFEHFMDIQETFDLNIDSSLRQVDVIVDNYENVYKFEIRVPALKRSH